MNQAFFCNQLSVCIDDKTIIRHLTFSLAFSSVHVLMGPNGSGKSTLARTLAGDMRYHITHGSIFLENTDITSMQADQRARMGLFLSFQQPCAIPGLTVFSFLKEAYSQRFGVIPDIIPFRNNLFRYLDILGMDSSFGFRNVHEGFSGGESKRLEMLQLLVLKPAVAILDEIDSGLDVDAIKFVAQSLAYARREYPPMTILLITHYQHILRYIQPDAVHIFHNGSIIHTGDASVASAVEEKGYDAFF